MEAGGTRFGVTGICGVAITTIIVSTDAPSGDGDVSDALAIINTGFERCTAIIRATGVEFVPIGTFGDEIDIISDLVGSGVAHVELAATCTVYAFCVGGQVPDGRMSGPTGISGVETITTTICMAVTDGNGDATAALACTSTACAPCTATIRATGVVCAPIGTCGVATITIGDLAGSGADGAELVDICTACASCGAGLVLAG